MHQHNLGIAQGGWSPDWPDGYGMMDELVNGNTIVPTGNTNISESNDPTINKLFADEQPGLTPAQRSAIYGQIDKQAMSDAVILPRSTPRPCCTGRRRLTNAYIDDPVRHVQLRRPRRRQLTRRSTRVRS